MDTTIPVISPVLDWTETLIGSFHHALGVGGFQYEVYARTMGQSRVTITHLLIPTITMQCPPGYGPGREICQTHHTAMVVFANHCMTVAVKGDYKTIPQMSIKDYVDAIRQTLPIK